ncbi:MAG TPA: hypothetical protein VFF04_02475 [Candidatus Babeliales bacterium]|nr:hypothetical protein [Candidatus Babeliales bacterium]
MLQKYLTPEQQGILWMIVGFLLLLYTLGLFTASLYFLFVLISLGIIACGFMESGLYPKVLAMIKKQKKTK